MEATEINILEFKEKVVALENALLEKHPTMKTLLRDIHKQIANDPELVTVLSEEDIGTIVKGLTIQTNTELVVVTEKSKAKADKKKLSTLDEFDI